MEDQLKELEMLQQQCQEYLAGWKRAQADYANLQKETDKARGEFVKYANEHLLQLLLPAIDQYETALAHTPDITTLPEEEQKKLKNWIIGLHAVRSLWENAFQNIGLEKVPVEGPFDPALHEAVGEEEGSDLPHGHVLRATLNGWRLNGKLLRPAKIILAIHNDE